jgi:BlaI family transcriptional regulator, penicillinase repressor
MPRTESEQPTELELEILKVLWQESPLAVRDVRARLELEAGRPLAHSSVITMLNIMYRKGLVGRRKVGKAFVFAPKDAKAHVTGNIVRDVLARVFDDSPAAMVLNLIDTADLDSDELAEIRKLIGRKAKEQKK